MCLGCGTNKANKEVSRMILRFGAVVVEWMKMCLLACLLFVHLFVLMEKLDEEEVD